MPDILPRDHWTVWVDSEEAPKYVGANIKDGNPNTFWHTQYTGSNPPYPHDLVIDLGVVALIEGFRALPRQDQSMNGQIGKYQLYVKTTFIDTPPSMPLALGEWAPVATGTFPNSKAERQVIFEPVIGRYVWLRALDEVQGTGRPWASLAEFNVLGSLYITIPEPGTTPEPVPVTPAPAPAYPHWDITENIPGRVAFAIRPNPADPTMVWQFVADIRPPQKD